jgi:hypothetical protein
MSSSTPKEGSWQPSLAALTAKLQKDNHDRAIETCRELASLAKENAELKLALQTANARVQMYQCAHETLTLALDKLLDQEAWKERLSGEPIWPCDACMVAHTEQVGPETLTCSACGKTKCADQFDSDFNNEDVSFEYCGDECKPEFIRVCGECQTAGAKCNKGNIRRCVCGEICCAGSRTRIAFVRTRCEFAFESQQR